MSSEKRVSILEANDCSDSSDAEDDSDDDSEVEEEEDEEEVSSDDGGDGEDSDEEDSQEEESSEVDSDDSDVIDVKIDILGTSDIKGLTVRADAAFGSIIKRLKTEYGVDPRLLYQDRGETLLPLTCQLMHVRGRLCSHLLPERLPVCASRLPPKTVNPYSETESQYRP